MDPRRASCALLLLACLGAPARADGEKNEHRCWLKLIPPEVTAVLPFTGPLGRLPEKFPALEKWVREQRLRATAGPYGVYLTDPVGTAPQVQRSEARVPVEWSRRELPAPARRGPRLVRQPAMLVLGTVRREGESENAASTALLVERRRRGLEFVFPRVIKRFPAPDQAKLGRQVIEHVVRTKGRADVGLYTDHGAHPNAIHTAAAAVLDAGLTVRPLRAEEINDGSFAGTVRSVLVPGGWAEDYTMDIDAEGAEKLRRFVAQGGGYVGVCAGAYYAMSSITWRGVESDYPFALVPGRAVGPNRAIARWPNHALAGIDLDAKHPLAKGMPARCHAFYLGGCALEIRDARLERPHEVVGRYAADDRPAIVTIRIGRGRVFLSGVHLEYDLTSDRDDLTWPESEGKLEDPESDWPLFQRAVRWAVGRD